MKPRLIIHGGAGRAMQDSSRKTEIRDALAGVNAALWRQLVDGVSAMDVVEYGCQLLEDDPLFNAGTGSVIQSDGQIRMSASLMDGRATSFSGVINVQQVRHPISMARVLQSRRDRVLAAEGAAILARELKLDIHDPITARRLKAWLEQYETSFEADVDTVVAREEDDRGHGTIGVVALDQEGHLVVGTSTGGRGFEYCGRVSDSATPAGNYANSVAAVSCTGIGEHILDASLASRIVIRTTDGLSLFEAFEKSMSESEARGHNLAAIGISNNGDVVWGKTSDILLAYIATPEGFYHTLDLPTGYHVGLKH